LSWNVAGVIRGGDSELLDLLNTHLTEMMNDGTIAELVEKYNVPYFKPFEEVGSTYTATEELEE
jgi:ABC-type amino acid transport substrate-binding protein